jgi:hypothetical protein
MDADKDQWILGQSEANTQETAAASKVVTALVEYV